MEPNFVLRCLYYTGSLTYRQRNQKTFSRRAKDNSRSRVIFSSAGWSAAHPPAEGKSHPKVVPEAGDFAPRLDDLHQTLDCAVCDAYGWEYDVLADEEEILRRLLALNLERGGQTTEG